MVTFTFFAFFSVIAIALLAIAYTASQRKRSGQNGIELVHYRRSQYSHATRPTAQR